MALDTQDKKYLDDRMESMAQKIVEKTVEKTHVSIRGDMEHFFGVLRDDFNHKFSILVEISKDKPGREEVREMIREETRYVIHDEMNKVFAPEVKEIRVTQGKHEKRITKLESALI